MKTSRHTLLISALLTLFGATMIPAAHALGPDTQPTIPVEARYVPILVVSTVWQILDTQTGLLASNTAYHSEAEALTVARKLNVENKLSKVKPVTIDTDGLKNGNKDGKGAQEVIANGPKSPTASIAEDAVREKLAPKQDSGQRNRKTH